MPMQRRRLINVLIRSGLCAAALLGALHAQAITLGHSRVVSAANEPLRIVVQVKDIDANALKSISAQIAPATSWQEVGLTPPVELESLSTHLLPGHQNNTMQLVLQSHQVPTAKVLDVLVDLRTETSTQRHQVSVLQTQPPVSVQLAPAAAPITSEAPARAQPNGSGMRYAVRAGQGLYAVARDLHDSRYDDYQLMAALLEANPDAFIQGNMNLLHAGVNLLVPDTQTVAAIDPQQAREQYKNHLQQFDEYRQRVAKGQPVAVAAVAEIEVPEEPVAIEPEVVVAKEAVDEIVTDRLELSAQSDAEAKLDQKTAVAQDLALTAERLSMLTEEFVPEPEPESEIALVEEVIVEDMLEEKAPVVESAVIVADSPPSDAATINTEPERFSAAWWKANIMWIPAGLFVLLVVLVAWFLRRAYNTSSDYAEIIPADAVRPRDKSEVESSEAEFREIK